VFKRPIFPSLQKQTLSGHIQETAVNINYEDLPAFLVYIRLFGAFLCTRYLDFHEDVWQENDMRWLILKNTKHDI